MNFKQINQRLAKQQPVFVEFYSKVTGMQVHMRVGAIQRSPAGGFFVLSRDGQPTEYLTLDRVVFNKG